MATDRMASESSLGRQSGNSNRADDALSETQVGSSSARPEVSVSSGALSRSEIQDHAMRGAIWTIGHTLLSIPLAFTVNLVIAKVLQADGYGRLAVLATAMQVAGGLVTLGLEPAVVQFGTKAHARGDRAGLRRILSRAQGFQLLFAAPLLTLLLAIFLGVGGSSILTLVVVFGVWLPAALNGSAMCMTIEHKTAEAAKLAMIGNLAVQSTVLCVALTMGTPDSVWAGRLFATGLVMFLALRPISADYRRAALRPSLPRHFPPGFWKFALPAGMSGFLATMVISRTEVFVLTLMSDGETTGVFALAFGVAATAFAPAQAIVGPLMPAASGLREVESASVRRAFERVIRTTSTVVATLVALVLVPLAVLVPSLYGRSYVGAAPLVIVLGFSAALTVATGPVSVFVLARFSSREALGSNFIALAVDLVLAVGLVPLLGAWGAATASVGGALTRMGILLRAERRSLGLSSRRLLPLLGSLPVGILSCSLGWAVALRLGADQPVSLSKLLVIAFAATLASLVSFLALIRMTRSGLSEQAVDAVARVIPSRLRVFPVAVIRRTIQTAPAEGG